LLLLALRLPLLKLTFQALDALGAYCLRTCAACSAGSRYGPAALYRVENEWPVDAAGTRSRFAYHRYPALACRVSSPALWQERRELRRPDGGEGAQWTRHARLPDGRPLQALPCGAPVSTTP